MVISQVAKTFTRKVKELNISAMMTIRLNMKMGKSHARRVTGHLIQDVSVKVSVLVFVFPFVAKARTPVVTSPTLIHHHSKSRALQLEHNAVILSAVSPALSSCMQLRSVTIQTCTM